MVERFRESLLDGILRGGAAAVSADADRQSPTPKRDSAARHLLTARNDGRLTEAQFCENLTVLFTASQENPQLALLSTLYLLAKHRDVQATLYEQLTTTKASETPLERQPLLTAVILESLRLFPPISQLINRLTTAPALLTSMTSVATSKTGSLPAHESRTVIIPAGTYVGYSTVAANRSRIHWVADADEFRPERWWTTPTTITESYVEVRHFSSNSNEESNDGGDVATDTASVRLAAIASLQRRQRRLGAFASFHGGRRACAGERLAMLELRVAIAGLVMRFEFGFEEGCGEGQGIRMMPAGPLCPRDLRLVFREREGTK